MVVAMGFVTSFTYLFLYSFDDILTIYKTLLTFTSTNSCKKHTISPIVLNLFFIYNICTNIEDINTMENYPYKFSRLLT